MTTADLQPSARTQSFEMVGGSLSVAAIDHLLVVALADWRVAVQLRPVDDERDEHLAFDSEARCIDVRKEFDTATL